MIHEPASKPLAAVTLLCALSLLQPAFGAARNVTRPVSELPVVANVTVPIGPGWLGVGFGSLWLSKSQQHVLLRIDPSSNKVVATIPVGPDPELGIGFGFGFVWIADTQDKTLRQIDPANNRVVRTIPVNIGSDPEGSFGVGVGSLWVLTNEGGTDSGTLTRLDPRTGRVVADIKVAPHSTAALVSEESVWVANTAGATVMRVDTRTNQVIATIPVRASPRFLAAGEGGIWVFSQGDGSVARIDPATNRVVATIDVGVPGPGGDLWVEDGIVWVSAEGAPVSMIDPMTNVLTRKFVGGQKDDTLRVAFGAVWVIEELSGKVWRISVDKIKHVP